MISFIGDGRITDDAFLRICDNLTAFSSERINVFVVHENNNYSE